MSKEKYYIAEWVMSNPGGGVRIIGFVEYETEEHRQPNGVVKRFISTTPKCLTVMPIQGDNGEEVVYNKEKIFLDKGEFIVQNNETNVNKLKNMVRNGSIKMRDLDVQYEFLGEDVPDEYEDVIVEDKVKVVDITPKGAPIVAENKKKELVERLQKGKKEANKE
jgi:hypothetical protein